MGKNNWWRGLGLLGFLGLALSCRAEVIIGDLGSGDSYLACPCGWEVYGAGIAVPFTLPSSADLVQILVALEYYYGGPDAATVELLNDSNGTPGATVLESWALTGLPSWQTVTTIQPVQTLTATTGIPLTGGTQYWILAEGDPTGSNDIWMPNDIGEANSNLPVCFVDCFNEFSTQAMPAFEVVGTPEPSSLLLFGAWLAGISLLLRRRFGRAGLVRGWRRKFAGVAAIAGLAAAAPLARADSAICTTPSSLAPGSQYRLVLVTAVTYASEDHNIADYNSAVNAEVNAVAQLAALNATWSVIGSSIEGVNAIDNIGADPGIPIYNLAGLLVANDATTEPGGLFSGQIQNLIDVDEQGDTLSNTSVWTGTASDGTGVPGSQLGQFNVEYGNTGSTSQWIDTGYYAYYGDFYPLYAISNILIADAPEPGTVMLLAAGLALLARRGLRRAVP